MSDTNAAQNMARLRRYHFGFLSTYPPMKCGLATFAAALEAEFVAAGNTVDIVRVDPSPDTAPLPSVAAEWRDGSAQSAIEAARVLSRGDLAVIQHEYGIFGGEDGEDVLDVMRAVTVPTIVVLHSVPHHPTPHQRSVLADVAAAADQLVVMTDTARERLLASYPVESAKVATIPHGASTAPLRFAPDTEPSRNEMRLLTWGLLGPGKGIEHVIDAIALLRNDNLPLRYTIAGVTHPKVLIRDGDEYRDGLHKQVDSLGLERNVFFDDTYRDVEALGHFIAQATAVVLPYDSRDQVTSGVLVDAIAAGKPVIASAFPHAIELLATGAGIVVPQNDPTAIADAIRTMVYDRDAYAAMTIEAQRLAPTLSWGRVARQYLELTQHLVGQPTAERRPDAIAV